jgi:hypothetical protein
VGKRHRHVIRLAGSVVIGRRIIGFGRRDFLEEVAIAAAVLRPD